MNTPTQLGTAAVNPNSDKSKAIIGALISLGGLALLIANLLFKWVPLVPVASWLLIAALITLFLLALGWNLNSMWYGAMIDNRNRVSLSRMQISLWTILVLSAYLTVAVMRSAPGAADTEVAKCKNDQIKQTLGIEDVDKFLQENRDKATAGDQQAAGALKKYADAEQKATDACKPQPLEITFPQELLLALGISTASFAGSNLITSIKRNQTNTSLENDINTKVDAAAKELETKKNVLSELTGKLMTALRDKNTAEKDLEAPPDDAAKKDAQDRLASATEGIHTLEVQLAKQTTEFDAAQAALDNLNTKKQAVSTEKEGLLKVNQTVNEASLSDMFQGDQIGNYQQIDLGKVQMFFFTVVIIVGYGVAFAGLLQDSAKIYQLLGMSLPQFSSSMNVLLGISHAGYLGGKSITQTATT